jgi:hypothetical protein
LWNYELARICGPLDEIGENYLPKGRYSRKSQPATISVKLVPIITVFGFITSFHPVSQLVSAPDYPQPLINDQGGSSSAYGTTTSADASHRDENQ